MAGPIYKSILITGASSGIGRALALGFAAPGVFLALSGRDAERLEAAVADCRRQGAEAEGRIIDVTDAQGMADWIEDIDSRHPLDLVIANAGVSGDTSGAKDTAGRERRIWDVNMMGVHNTVSPAVEKMRARRHGQIALMSSLAAFRGLPGAIAYSSSKAWVKSYGEGLRGRLARSGIGVSVIYPGFVESRITDANTFHMPGYMDADRAARIIARGLARNRARIAFPFGMYAGIWLLSILPPAWTDRFFRMLPAKI